MRNGLASRRVMWAPAISVIGGGALPTPTTQERKRRGPNSKQQGLSNTENWLPTPRANSAMTVDLRTQQNRPELQPNLETVMARMLRTPTVNDAGNSTFPPSQRGRDSLPGQMLCDDSVPTGPGTHLNPSFVEEMMGFPLFWTQLDD